MAISLKMWLSTFFFVFLAISNAQSDSGDSDSGDSGDSVSISSPESPDEPTRSPSQQALNALIRACPCFEELGGDERDALEEVREECLGGGSVSDSDSVEELFTCLFDTTTAGDATTLTCEEDVIALNQTAQTCTLSEVDDGELEVEEVIELTAAQTAICAAALAGVADDFSCETQAPTLSPTAAPTALTCQQFTLDTNASFADTGATAAEREAFALDLVTQATGNIAGVQITIDNVLDNGGFAVIEYTLCAADPADISAASANVAAAIANGTVFDVGGIPVGLTGNVPGTTTTTTTTTTTPPAPEPDTTTGAPDTTTTGGPIIVTTAAPGTTVILI